MSTWARFVPTSTRRCSGRAIELIEDEEPYYGEVPELQGVWATGRTLEGCRQNLMEVADGWLLVRIARKMPIPSQSTS